jgi:sulfite reductase (NADPH) flavoprotein alpha-component
MSTPSPANIAAKDRPRTLGKTYVDPLTWAKTVAPFAVPFSRELQGPSGTSSPLFSTLDVFFGRSRYASALGRECARSERAIQRLGAPSWLR